jgi:hypothetical protein
MADGALRELARALGREHRISTRIINTHSTRQVSHPSAAHAGDLPPAALGGAPTGR